MAEGHARDALIGPGAFRLFLAGMVFLSHVSSWAVGTAAVILFLMLSGYWVTTIYTNDRYAGAGPYLLGRLMRLWPVLIVCTLVAAAIQMAVRGDLMGNLWSTLFFLGLASRGDDVVGVVWSLDIELQFYLLLPLVVAGLLAAGERWRPMLAAGAVLALAAGMLLGRAGLVTALLFAPAFAAGIWLKFGRWKPGAGLAWASLLLFLLALVAYVRLAPGDVQELAALNIRHFSVATLLVSLLAVPFVAWNVNVRAGAFDRWLGDLSYPFYLLHFPIIYGVLQTWGDTPVAKGAALLLSLLATVAVNLLVDRPCEAWRRRLLVARERPA